MRQAREERRQRDDIRHERKSERERERRLEARDAHGGKRSKLTRDRDRDISEKVALGQVKPPSTSRSIRVFVVPSPGRSAQAPPLLEYWASC